MSATTTLFRAEALTFQGKQALTKGSEFKQGAIIVAISVAIFLIAALSLSLFTGGIFRIIDRIALYISPIGILGGLIIVIRSQIRRTKVITCPQCSTQHTIFADVRQYICPTCLTSLFLDGGGTQEPQSSTCPYCEMTSYVCPDHGQFLCPNCGIIRNSDSNILPRDTTTCTQCGAVVPRTAIYCTSCQHILISDFSQPRMGLEYSMNWKAGKNAVGHMQFSKALLAGVVKKIDAAKHLGDVPAALAQLREIFISLEEALQDPNLRSTIEAMMPEIDTIYLSILDKELVFIETIGLKREIRPDEVATIRFEPHMVARRKIELLIGPAIESLPVVGVWNEKLVEFVISRQDRVRIGNYSKLKAEIERFKMYYQPSAQQSDMLSNAETLSNLPRVIPGSQKSSWICSVCGGYLRSDATFCKHCRAQFASKSSG